MSALAICKMLNLQLLSKSPAHFGTFTDVENKCDFEKKCDIEVLTQAQCSEAQPTVLVLPVGHLPSQIYCRG